jgi:hypothetical protein
MNNQYNDPFYLESSYINADGVNMPGPSQNNVALPGLGGGPVPTGGDIDISGGGQGFQNILDKAPEYLNVLGSVVGMVKTARDQRGQAGTNQITAICGKKPLINKAKKQAYAQCVQRVLNPPVQAQNQRTSEGMSTSTKIIIGVVVVIVLVGITILIVKLSKSKKA